MSLPCVSASMSGFVLSFQLNKWEEVQTIMEMMKTPGTWRFASRATYMEEPPACCLLFPPSSSSLSTRPFFVNKSTTPRLVRRWDSSVKRGLWSCTGAWLHPCWWGRWTARCCLASRTHSSVSSPCPPRASSLQQLCRLWLGLEQGWWKLWFSPRSSGFRTCCRTAKTTATYPPWGAFLWPWRRRGWAVATTEPSSPLQLVTLWAAPSTLDWRVLCASSWRDRDSLPWPPPSSRERWPRWRSAWLCTRCLCWWQTCRHRWAGRGKVLLHAGGHCGDLGMGAWLTCTEEVPSLFWDRASRGESPPLFMTGRRSDRVEETLFRVYTDCFIHYISHATLSVHKHQGLALNMHFVCRYPTFKPFFQQTYQLVAGKSQALLFECISEPRLCSSEPTRTTSIHQDLGN